MGILRHKFRTLLWKHRTAAQLAKFSGGLLEPPPEFDYQFYSETVNTKFDSQKAAWFHYLTVGRELGGRPSKEFEPDFYLARYQDVKAADVVDPFVHFIRHGRDEDRLPAAPPLSKFNIYGDGRVSTEADIRLVGKLAEKPQLFKEIVGLYPDEYFQVTDAQAQGPISPLPGFSALEYCWRNPDIERAEVNPISHWFNQSFEEMRESTGGDDAVTLILAPKPTPLEETRLVWRTSAEPMVLSINLREKISKLCSNKVVQIHISNDSPFKNIGGTQRYLVEQFQSKVPGSVFLTIYPSMPSVIWESEDSPVVIEANGIDLGMALTSQLPEIFDEFQALQATFSIHGLNGHNVAGILEFYKVLKIDHSRFVLHDASTLCPNHTLTWQGLTYCGAPPMASTQCSTCTFASARRRQIEAVERLLPELQDLNFEFVGPSQFIAELASSRLGVSVSVIPHGNFEVQGTRFSPVRSIPKLRIAFAGFPSVAKGWADFVDLATSSAHDRRIEFFHFGNSTSTYDWSTNIQWVKYRDGIGLSLQEQFIKHQIHILLVAPIGSETYSYVAESAIAAGVSILTFNHESAVAEIADRHSVLLPFLSRAELKGLARKNRLFEWLLDSIPECADVGHFVPNSNPQKEVEP
jgi:hypothetical protein